MAPKVIALLLAAGSSTRMPRLKQLLPVGNRPAVRYCLDTILASGIRDVTVVIGPDAGEIEKALAGTSVAIVVNPDRDSAMADSVRAGLETLSDDVSGIMICLADHPLVGEETIRSILRLHAGQPDRIIIPSWNRRRGHPTLFPRSVLYGLGKGRSLRDLIAANAGRLRYLETDDEGVVLDMDTQDDYEKIAALAARHG